MVNGIYLFRTAQTSKVKTTKQIKVKHKTNKNSKIKKYNMNSLKTLAKVVQRYNVLLSHAEILQERHHLQNICIAQLRSMTETY